MGHNGDHNGSPGKPLILSFFFSDLHTFIVQFVLTRATIALHISFQIHNIENVCRLLTDKQITNIYNMQSAVRSWLSRFSVAEPVYPNR